MVRKRIRLLQITHGLGIGGMERVLIELCRHLDPELYELTVYCTHVLGPLETELSALDVPVVFEPVRRRSDHWLRGFQIHRFLRRQRFDVVHTHHMASFLDAALPVRLAGVPVFVHTDHSKLYPHKRRLMLAERMLSGLTDAFCAVSEHTRRELSAFEGVPLARIQVVYNGLDIAQLPGPNERREVRAQLGIEEGAPLVGTVGRLEWQKGHDLLLDAMPLVLAQIPEAHAVIVGGGSKEQELRSRVRELGLEKRVHLTGSRSDPLRFLSAFDLFATTSNFEGMPMVLLEAMALSLPVLATSVGGVPEVVEDGVTGGLVNDREPVHFADAVVQLLSNPARLEQYGKAGRARYERCFRVGAMVERYDSIYRGFLERHTGG